MTKLCAQSNASRASRCQSGPTGTRPSRGTSGYGGRNRQAKPTSPESSTRHAGRRSTPRQPESGTPGSSAKIRAKQTAREKLDELLTETVPRIRRCTAGQHRNRGRPADINGRLRNPVVHHTRPQDRQNEIRARLADPDHRVGTERPDAHDHQWTADREDRYPGRPYPSPWIATRAIPPRPARPRAGRATGRV